MLSYSDYLGILFPFPLHLSIYLWRI